MDKILLGSHVSMSGPDYYLGSVKEALSYGENVFMFYTGAPQNNKRTPLENCKIKEGIELAQKGGIILDKIVCHAPYMINLGNSDPDKFKFSKDFLKSEILRCEGFGCNLLVLHPGLHVHMGEEIGINNIIRGLNEVFNDLKELNVTICLETMAGKGTELGITFEQIKKIIDGIDEKYQNNVGVCLDTCHINDGGYIVDDIDEVLNRFDDIIGLKLLKVIHLNDSKNPLGAHKDRHENIGFGEIGFDSLIKYVYDSRLVDIPKILETPYIENKPPYKEEIEMIKKKEFNPSLKDIIASK